MSDLVGILSFEQMHSRFDIGSSRIRALWLLKYWPDAELFRIGGKYSTVIFQKAYWLDYARHFPGIKILDICDPDFLHWNSQCISMANLCDAITTSTDALARAISQYTSTPTICIPDRLDLESFAKFRKHHEGIGGAQTAAWFGYSTNFPTLDHAVPDLLRLGIRRLIVISDKPDLYELPPAAFGNLELTTYSWDFDALQVRLLEADILLNYQFDFGRWRYKSNNKTLFGWATGLPVAHTATELFAWMPEEARVRESRRRLAEVHRDYSVRKSVEEYKALIIDIQDMQKTRSSTPEATTIIRDGLDLAKT